MRKKQLTEAEIEAEIAKLDLLPDAAAAGDGRFAEATTDHPARTIHSEGQKDPEAGQVVAIYNILCFIPARVTGSGRALC